MFEPVDAFRAWTEIDLDALAANLAVVRRRAGAGTRVMLVVKQDAYGHGAVAVAHHAARCGVGALGVGTSSEALELREAGIRLPILVLGTVVEEELAACLRNEVHVGLHSTDRARGLARLARHTALRARVHLNVDTGMGRLGLHPEPALELLEKVAAPGGLAERGVLELAGVMTHIASPEGGQCASAVDQIARFDAFLEAAQERGLLRGWVHAANSAALFTGLTAGASHGPFDTVRPGIACYGALPSHLPGAHELTPVMSLKSRIVFLKDVPAGTPVGYSSIWRAPRATRIATLAIGYGHGLPYALEGWDVLIGGRRAPLVGRISMDYSTVDVGELPGVEVGQVATLLGRDGDQELRLEDLAIQAGTILYDVTCSLGRLRRVYRGGDAPTLPAQPPAPRKTSQGPVEPSPATTNWTDPVR